MGDFLKVYYGMSISPKRKRIYISGPMTGIKNFNHEAFNKKAKELRALGNDVCNPAEHDGGSTDKDRSFYLRIDIEELLTCDAVVLLDGWKNSKGAQLEVAIAKELKLRIYDSNLEPLREESICQEADYLVSNDRGNDYGPPKHDFLKTAKLWEVILGIENIKPEQIGLCMIALKLSRELNKHKRDNLVDICGYAKTVDIIIHDKTEYNV
jgi:hypothetical protein